MNRREEPDEIDARLATLPRPALDATARRADSRACARGVLCIGG